jgi:hypothetical protein
MQNKTVQNCEHKSNRLIPHKMSSSKGKWDVIARDQAVQGTVMFFAKRHGLRAAEPDASKDRLNNPLVSAHSAPGGGKSVFLDLLGRLVGTDWIKSKLSSQQSSMQSSIQPTREEPGNADSVRKVATCILNMARLSANFDWPQYEEFHAEWEVMKRELYLDSACQCA